MNRPIIFVNNIKKASSGMFALLLSQLGYRL